MMRPRQRPGVVLLSGLTLLAATCISALPADAKTRVLPGFRTAFGSSWPIESKGEAGFSFEALLRVGVVFGQKRRIKGFIIDPVLGYNYQHPGYKTHLFVLGTDLGYSFGPMLAIVAGARGVVGSTPEVFAGGLRSVLAADVLFGILRAEATHQMLWQDGEMRQTVGFMVGFDVLRALGFFMMLSTLLKKK